MDILERCRTGEYEIGDEAGDEIESLRAMVRCLVGIIESEYPEDDERYQFAMNCLTDVGEK